MKEIKKMGQHCRRWSIMVLGIIGCWVLMGMTDPLLAGENQTPNKQLRLADHAQLMYGLKSGKVHGRKTQHTAVASPGHQRTQVRPTPRKKGLSVTRKGGGAAGVTTTKRASAAHSRQRGQHGTPLRATRLTSVARTAPGGSQKKWSATHRKLLAQGRHGKRPHGSGVVQKDRQTDGLFAASVERRMGTFTGPVNGLATPRSSGLFFRVAENADVKATSRGQVVYAGWFRGYGMLAIVNHGGRVYSLYGHNHDLLVAKGDFVEPGQVIAKSGKTGSVDGVPGLYFEIRKGNRPDNPRRWLVKEKWHSDKLASIL